MKVCSLIKFLLLKKLIILTEPSFISVENRTNGKLFQRCCARHQSAQLPFKNSIKVCPNMQKIYGIKRKIITVILVLRSRHK